MNKRILAGTLTYFIAAVAYAGGAPAVLFGAPLSNLTPNTWGGATLPTAPTTFSTAMPATLSCANTNHGGCYQPTDGASLQTDLNAAAADTGSEGDIIECTAGATYTTTSTFTLPARAGGSSGTIYIISSDAPEIGGSGLPAAGTRVGPSNVADMCALRTSAANGGYVMERATGSGVTGYRMVGLDMQVQDANESGGVNYYIVNLDNGDTSVSTLAQHITFDRDYFDGSPAYGVVHAVEIDGQYNAVIESYFGTHIYSVGNADNQDIAAWNGLGPYILNDNYFQAGGESTIFGGSATTLPSPSEESDITEDNNHFYKNYFTAQGYVTSGSTSLVITSTPSSGYVMLTNGAEDPNNCLPGVDYITSQVSGADQGAGTYTLSAAATCSDGSAGVPVTITGIATGKNMVEFKTGKRVQFKGNYLDNAGTEGQARSAFVLTSRNSNGANGWNQLTDFDIEDDTFTNAQYGGINVLCQDNVSGGYDTEACARMLFRNLLLILSKNDGSTSTTPFLVMSSSPSNDFQVSFTAPVAGGAASATLTNPITQKQYRCLMGYSGSGADPNIYNDDVYMTVGNGSGSGTSSSVTFSWQGGTSISAVSAADCSVAGNGGGSDIIIDHVTFAGTAANGMQSYLDVDAMDAQRLVVSNSVFSLSEYGIIGPGGSPATFSAAIPVSFSDVDFINNVIVQPFADSTIPAGNFQPTANSAVGFTSFGSNTSAAGYALTGASAYHAKGVSLSGLPYNSAGTPDGTDIGANISLLPTN